MAVAARRGALLSGLAAQRLPFPMLAQVRGPEAVLLAGEMWQQGKAPVPHHLIHSSECLCRSENSRALIAAQPTCRAGLRAGRGKPRRPEALRPTRAAHKAGCPKRAGPHHSSGSSLRGCSGQERKQGARLHPKPDPLARTVGRFTLRHS